MAKTDVAKPDVAKKDGAVASLKRLHRHIECRLDQELEQTFPASDALQITRDTPQSYKRRPRPLKVKAAKTR